MVDALVPFVDRSLGHQDPGATSFALLMAAVAAELARAVSLIGERE